MAYRTLASVILAVHFVFLAYVVLGGFLAWRWPRLFWPHLAAAAWAVALITARLSCPLTVAEDWARRRAGQTGAIRGFVDSYLEGVLYPQRYTGLMQALGALVVIGSWVGLYLRWRSRRAASTADTDRKSADSSDRTATV